MLLHGNVLVFYGCVEQPIIFSISNFDEGTNVQILGAGSATSTAECRMGCRLYLVRVLVTTVGGGRNIRKISDWSSHIYIVAVLGGYPRGLPAKPHLEQPFPTIYFLENEVSKMKLKRA